jgi:hypothetical protein
MMAVGVVGAVANEAQGQGVYETGVERGRRGRDESNLVRRSRGGTRGERKTKTVCHCPAMPMSFEPLPRLVFPTQPPPFRHDERAVDTAFRQVELATVVPVLGKGVEDALQRAIVHPALEPAVAGLVRWVRSGRSAHCAPVRTIHKMPSSTSRLLRDGRPRPSRHVPDERFEHRPMVVRQIHAAASSRWMQPTTYL